MRGASPPPGPRTRRPGATARPRGRAPGRPTSPRRHVPARLRQRGREQHLSATDGQVNMSTLQGWMTPEQWRATRDMPELPASSDGLARVTTYAGTTFRSALEANWAATLDQLDITWEYEPWLYRAPSGVRYLPDFWLPDIRTFIEVKGEHMERGAKPQELAERIKTDDIIVLMGFPPLRVSYSPYSWESKMKWHDPLGYDTRLALCPHCSAWQWMRAQLSRRCRACGEGHSGLLARSGEMPFHSVPESRFEPVASR